MNALTPGEVIIESQNHVWPLTLYPQPCFAVVTESVLSLLLITQVCLVWVSVVVSVLCCMWFVNKLLSIFHLYSNSSTLHDRFTTGPIVLIHSSHSIWLINIPIMHSGMYTSLYTERSWNTTLTVLKRWKFYSTFRSMNGLSGMRLKFRLEFNRYQCLKANFLDILEMFFLFLMS